MITNGKRHSALLLSNTTIKFSIKTINLPFSHNPSTLIHNPLLTCLNNTTISICTCLHFCHYSTTHLIFTLQVASCVLPFQFLKNVASNSFTSLSGPKVISDPNNLSSKGSTLFPTVVSSSPTGTLFPFPFH